MTYSARGLRGTSEIDAAAAWVDRQSAVGSTDINRVLLEAVSMADTERPTYLIFLTDGLPTEGVIESEEILNNFAENAPNNLRLFAFGVGYDVDTFLLDSLAQEHHGTSTYVLPGEPIDEIVSGFYARVSTPVLMDLQLDFGELTAYDIYPNPLPDLFAGSQIVVLGRYREGGQTEITLTGVVNDQTQTFDFPNQTFQTESSKLADQSSIPRLWATRKIGYLLNQIRLHGPTQEIIDQIVRLRIRYGIVTRYTSYLVTEPQPLGADEQERIVEETFNQMKSAPVAPSYGQDAVEQAAEEGAMRDAESIRAPSEEVANLVRIVGSSTFFYMENIWVDTAFDPDSMQTVNIAFLSDDYFALVETDPQLGAAFALGPNVIAISHGVAYKVVAEGSVVPPIEFPESIDNQTPENNAPTATPENLPEQILSNKDVSKTSTPTPVTDSKENSGQKSAFCYGGMVPLAFIPLIGLIFSRMIRKNWR